nr:hypothetical protein [Tanacetum cinerariifolium]
MGVVEGGRVFTQWIFRLGKTRDIAGNLEGRKRCADAIVIQTWDRDIPTDLPTAPELPSVLPFLCLDDSKSKPADELPKRHVSPRFYDDVVSRDSYCPYPTSTTEIATASSACISTPGIIASSVVRSRIRTTARKSTLGLRPVMTPARSTALRRARRAALSLETSSSDNSAGSSSDSTCHTTESSFTTSLLGTQISSEDHSHHSSEAVRSLFGPLTRKRLRCIDYTTPTSSSSAGPSRKRSRSSATSIPSTVHTVRGPITDSS